MGNGCLYIKVQKKTTESILADCRRWLFDKSKPETVQSLRQWLIRETEFLAIAAETIKELGPLKDNSIILCLEKINKEARRSQGKSAQNVKNSTQLEMQSIQVIRCEKSLDISQKEQTLL